MENDNSFLFLGYRCGYMNRIAIITNIPSPYRVDLFYYLQKKYTDYEIYVIYTARNEDNRNWCITNDKIINSFFLSSKIIKYKGAEDVRYVHLPGNVCGKLSDLAPDIVIASEYNPAALQACLWCKLHKKPFIHWTDGTLHSEQYIGILQKISRKIIISSCSCAIASSSKAKEKLLAWGLEENKIYVSLLTVDITTFVSLNRDIESKTLLCVGRIVPGKNIEFLMQVLSLVKHDFILNLVGDGDSEYVQSLISLSKKYKIYNKVKFVGFKQGQALCEEYAKARALVFPTRYDCFGLVMVEALAAGLPIIASQYADGAYDIIENKNNGEIVALENIDKWISVIENVLSNSDTYCERQEELIAKFTFENVSKAFIEAIDSVQTK